MFEEDACVRLDREPPVGCGHGPVLTNPDVLGHERPLVGFIANVLDHGVRYNQVESIVSERKVAAVGDHIVAPRNRVFGTPIEIVGEQTGRDEHVSDTGHTVRDDVLEGLVLSGLDPNDQNRSSVDAISDGFEAVCFSSSVEDAELGSRGLDQGAHEPSLWQRRRLNHRLLTAFVACLCLLLAACSSGSDQQSSIIVDGERVTAQDSSTADETDGDTAPLDADGEVDSDRGSRSEPLEPAEQSGDIVAAGTADQTEPADPEPKPADDVDASPATDASPAEAQPADADDDDAPAPAVEAELVSGEPASSEPSQDPGSPSAAPTGSDGATPESGGAVVSPTATAANTGSGAAGEPDDASDDVLASEPTTGSNPSDSDDPAEGASVSATVTPSSATDPAEDTTSDPSEAAPEKPTPTATSEAEPGPAATSTSAPEPDPTATATPEATATPSPTPTAAVIPDIPDPIQPVVTSDGPAPSDEIVISGAQIDESGELELLSASGVLACAATESAIDSLDLGDLDGTASALNEAAGHASQAAEPAIAAAAPVLQGAGASEATAVSAIGVMLSACVSSGYQV